MGWRTSHNYERAQLELWRTLPLRDRYNWTAIAFVTGCIAAALLAALV